MIRAEVKALDHMKAKANPAAIARMSILPAPKLKRAAPLATLSETGDDYKISR